MSNKTIAELHKSGVIKPKAHNTDAKSVSSKQSWEPKYVCRVFKDKDGKHLKKDALTQVMKNLGKNGKLCRSRRNIYVGLRALGYTYFPRK